VVIVAVVVAYVTSARLGPAPEPEEEAAAGATMAAADRSPAAA
jgi:hypothetical protein